MYRKLEQHDIEMFANKFSGNDSEVWTHLTQHLHYIDSVIVSNYAVN